MTTTQQEIYDYSSKELVESVLEGFNATIFAYGQTSSGKTYTMEGDLDNPEKEGIVPRMIRHVFHNILISNGDIEFIVKMSMIEIYMEKIHDLIDLNKSNLAIRETKEKEIYIEDLSEHYVSNEEDLLNLVKLGSENRTVHSTNMNQYSSRSHTIVILTIHQKNTKTLEAKKGKLYLVDLAGSEKISKTGSTGLTLEEGKIINKSLSTLGMVINALTDGKSSHIPYRESKLTRVLQESLGGNAKTCLIITCSPSQFNESETLSTLRFGTRAKKIKNKPKINKEETVQELKLQIEKLEKIIVLSNARIKQLNEFIENNNLQVPEFEGEEGDLILVEQNNNKENNKNNENKNNKNIENNDINNNELETIERKYTNMLNKLPSEEINTKLEEANIKIKDLQVIIDQKEKIIDDMEQKEIKYTKTINDLTEKLMNFQSKELVKNCLKLIDKKILNDFYNQMKDYTLNLSNKNPKIKEVNKRVLENIFNIVNNNYNLQQFNQYDLEKLTNRLEISQTNKLSIIQNGQLIDFKEMNENYKINNITNEALLKSVSEKNEKISRLESDLKEYKEKIDIFENNLTPDEKNLSKKIYTLEKNLEQVNAMYHQIVKQKSVLKIENQIFEKKLKKRDEKITILLKENYGLLEQLRMRDDKLNYLQKNKNLVVPQVVKVLRGGNLKNEINNNNNVIEANNNVNNNNNNVYNNDQVNNQNNIS